MPPLQLIALIGQVKGLRMKLSHNFLTMGIPATPTPRKCIRFVLDLAGLLAIDPVKDIELPLT